MRRPKEPHNYSFWKTVVENPEEVEDFMRRGSPRQKKSILQAMKIQKWERIQTKKLTKNKKETAI